VSKIVFGILAGLIVGVSATWTLLKHHDSHEEKKEEHHEASSVIHTNDQTFVKLDSKSQEHAGLRLAPLEAATLKVEVKAFGRVLDPAPLVASLAEHATARIAVETSMKDYNRLKLLHSQDQNVSARTLDAAESLFKRDQLLVQMSELRLMGSWGAPIAGQPELPNFVHALATLEAALVRVDVPLGDALKAAPATARIASVSAPDRPMTAQFLGTAVSADPQTQGQGFLYLLKPSPFVPASAVIAWLDAGGEEEKGVTVPRAALVRHQGEVFIYVQAGEELFERKLVELEHPTEAGWFVHEALKPGQKIVVTGAQQLLSEELKGQGEEE
jgi:hypothetical protein